MLNGFNANELPLRYLLAKMDGKSVGLRAFHDQLVNYLRRVKIGLT